MSDLEKRIDDLEARMDRLEPHVERTMPLGPNNQHDPEAEARQQRILTDLLSGLKKDTPPVDRSKQQLVDGNPVPEDQSHTGLKANGQQKDYVVLTPEERSKGFVRPVRRSYRHVGPLGPQHQLRELTDEQKARYADVGYVAFEPYPESKSLAVGRYWMQSQLDSVGKGCGTVTTMGHALAETYARDPKFYSGTFCCGCGKHLQVDEFVWDGTTERVGS